MHTETYAIIGGTLWGNRGAEAMVSTTVGRVRERRPDARFQLLSYYPGRDRRLCRDPGVAVDSATPPRLLVVFMPFACLAWLCGRLGLRWPDALLPAAVRRLRACTALLDVSGISFHDGRLAVLVYNVFCIWPALLLGVPVLHLSQARGPFEHPLNRLLARRFLAACRQSFARGRITAGYMAGLGLPAERWSVAADVAFGFRAGDSLTREGEHETGAALVRMRAAQAAGREVVAISPSSVVLAKTEKAGIDYVGILARAVAHLHGLGHHVLVLPNATRAGEPGLRNNDIPVIEAVRARLPDPVAADEAATSWICCDLNTDGIRRLLEPCRLLVTSRFHAMVAALSLGTPVFVVGWSHKYEEVLDLFGCGGDAIDFAGLDEGLLPALDGMLAACDQRRRQIAAAWPGVEASSLAQFDWLQGPPSGHDPSRR